MASVSSSLPVGEAKAARWSGIAAAIALSLSVLSFLGQGFTQWTSHELDVTKAKTVSVEVIQKFFDQLVDPDPKRRAVALILLKNSGLDRESVAEIAALVAVRDSSGEVRGNAAQALRKFAVDQNPAVREIAEEGLSKYSLAAELRSKGLVASLEEASRFAATRSSDGLQEAFLRYVNALNRLSPEGKSSLDPQLFYDAERAIDAGFADSAVRVLSRLFEPYVVDR